MAWIESHQSLLTHRKTLKAASLLRVDRHKLLGHLHALWWWGLDNANDNGLLGRVLDEELAQAAGWPLRQAETFVSALVEVGFIDRDGVNLYLHDWWEYAGKLNTQRELRRESNRKAQTARRQRLRQHDVSADNADSQQPTQPTNQPNQPTSNDVIPTTPTNQEASSEVFHLYEELCGTTITHHIAELLMEAERDYSPEWIRDAFHVAAENNVKKLNYVLGVLAHWAEEGRDSEAKKNGSGSQIEWFEHRYREAQKQA